MAKPDSLRFAPVRILALLLLAGSLSFCQKKADSSAAVLFDNSDRQMIESEKEQNVFKLTGRVFVGGNEPFTVTMLRLENNEAIGLVGPESQRLRQLQNRTIRVEGFWQDDHNATAAGAKRSLHVTDFQLAK